LTEVESSPEPEEFVVASPRIRKRQGRAVIPVFLLLANGVIRFLLRLRSDPVAFRADSSSRRSAPGKPDVHALAWEVHGGRVTPGGVEGRMMPSLLAGYRKPRVGNVEQ